MKKSEMIEKMTKVMNVFSRAYTTKEMAELILDVQEEVGMLPPDMAKTYCHECEDTEVFIVDNFYWEKE